MAEAEIVAGGPNADLTEHPGSGSYIGDLDAPRCVSTSPGPTGGEDRG